MSEQRTGRPGDWRRRRRPEPEPAPEASDGDSGGDSSEEATPQPGGEVVLSRTMFSYLEPTLDRIASYSTPLVIAGVVALVSGIILVAFVSSMRLYGIIDIGIGIGLIALVALIQLSSVAAAFISRTGRYGVNSAVMMTAFTGIIVVIGVIAFENNRRFDLTATNQFSLADRTEDILENLEEPVQAIAFYKEARNPNLETLVRRTRVEETFRDFRSARADKFSYEFKDPDLVPDIVRNYFGDTPAAFVNQSVVLEGVNTGIIHTIEPSDRSFTQFEQELVSGILVVSGEEQKTVYFLEGHGERNINSGLEEGYRDIGQWLVGENYKVESLRWELEDEDVSVPDGTCPEGAPPADCMPEAAMIVIAGPKFELPEAHRDVLDQYLSGPQYNAQGEFLNYKGGRIIFLAEPDTPDSFTEFLARWGVIALPGYVLDEVNSPIGQPRTLKVQAFNLLQLPQELIGQVPQPILQTLLGITTPKGQPLGDTYMPGATAFVTVNDNQRLPIPLAFTSDETYLIDDIQRDEPIKGDGEDADRKGRFSPVVYVQAVARVGEQPLTPTAEGQPGSLIAFGDSDFLTNSSLATGRGSGIDFFLNSANYLLGDFALESIRAKALTFRELNLNRNEEQFVQWTSWLFLPGIMGLLAALVWWVRR